MLCPPAILSVVLIVTTETIPGYEIAAVAGLVDVQGYAPGAQSAFRASEERARALEKIVSEAKELGANAIVGLRVETVPDLGVFAYGTAVWIAPLTVAATEQYEAMVRDGEVPPQP